MNTEEKKGFLLLKSVIFHYHGLDYEEQKKLEDSENQVKKLKKDISLHEIKEISCAYRGCIYE